MIFFFQEIRKIPILLVGKKASYQELLLCNITLMQQAYINFSLTGGQQNQTGIYTSINPLSKKNEFFSM